MAIEASRSDATSPRGGFISLLKKFYEGNLYPALIALTVLIGYVKGIEFYLNILIVLSTSAALIICKSAKPFLPTLFLILCQINVQHTPGIPTFSDYYITGHRLVIVIILIVILAASVGYYFFKNIAPRLSFKSPLFFAVAALSVAFILNGAGSSEWKIGNLAMGLGEALVYFLLFYVLYYGLENMRAKEAVEYFSYLSLLVAIVLLGELAYVYLTNDRIFKDGTIIKQEILFGWTINNPFGFQLATLIPPLMRGAMKSKRIPFVYLIAAIATWAGAILTLSRNAWLFATLAMAICVIIACFHAEHKKLYRVLTITALAGAAVAAILLREQLMEKFSSVIDMGFSDNGRYALWKQAVDNFLDAPIFGKGFYGFGVTDVYITIEFLPSMAHNTPLQLLSAMGAVGAAAYGYYRIKTLVPLFKKPSYEKVMLYLVMAVTLGASLLDNFVFYFVNMFPYMLALAIIFKLHKEQMREARKKAGESKK